MRAPSVGGYQTQSVIITNPQPLPMYESCSHLGSSTVLPPASFEFHVVNIQ